MQPGFRMFKTLSIIHFLGNLVSFELKGVLEQNKLDYMGLPRLNDKYPTFNFFNWIARKSSLKLTFKILRTILENVGIVI